MCFQVVHIVNISHTMTVPLAPIKEETMCSHVKIDVQQADEARVVERPASFVSTGEAAPSALPVSFAADATQTAAVQHGQAEPTLAVVLQKLDLMQAQMNAVQHSVVEAMAEAAFWRNKYAEAAGLV